MNVPFSETLLEFNLLFDEFAAVERIAIIRNDIQYIHAGRQSF